MYAYHEIISHLIKFPGLYYTLTIVFGTVLAGALFLLLTTLLMRKVMNAKKTAAAVVMNNIDEGREAETRRESESVLEVEEEKTRA